MSPQNSYVEVLASRTSEYGNTVTADVISEDKVILGLGGTLNPCDWGPYQKGKFGHTHTPGRTPRADWRYAAMSQGTIRKQGEKLGADTCLAFGKSMVLPTT